MGDNILAPSTTVIRTVSNCIKKTLSDNIGSLAGTDITFSSPGEFEQPDDGNIKLSLFLIDLKIKPGMRNHPRKPAVLDDGGSSPNVLVNPPVALDLIYMITPLENDSESQMDMLEHVMGVLYDFPVLREDLLGETLALQKNTRVNITPVEYSIETLYNIWSIFPNRSYRTSLFYLVSPVKIISGRGLGVTRVASKNINKLE